MIDPSVFLWLQQIRYQTESYEEQRAATSCRHLLEDGVDKMTLETARPVFGFPFEVKHASECRLSCEFLEESVEELSPATVEVVVDAEGEEPEDVMLWKSEIRYEYSSEEECEEFAQQVDAGGKKCLLVWGFRKRTRLFVVINAIAVTRLCNYQMCVIICANLTLIVSLKFKRRSTLVLTMGRKF